MFFLEENSCTNPECLSKSHFVERPYMNVALVHDWLTGMRGGEKCLEVFCELFPDAPIYTLFHVKGSVSQAIERHRIMTSFLNSVPFSRTSYRYFLPFSSCHSVL